MSSLELAALLNQELLDNPTIKAFQEYQSSINNNQELIALESKIKAYQKAIVNLKARKDDNATRIIEEYKQTMDEFNHHPLLVNYLYLKEEVDYLLQNINVQINGQLLDNDLTK
ncbi:YlbF family regulator [Tannockella kyphosi]|uniref:YlbF family regulator n=1 Tax=Tannockella kyphosi TaxID=2899121 RepID=UPI00201209E9|nr:YlbF family regulator [Tannockella kyphosi]